MNRRTGLARHYTGEDAGAARRVLSERPVIHVGRVMQMTGVPIGIWLDVEHALRDGAALTGAGEARVLEVEKHAGMS